MPPTATNSWLSRTPFANRRINFFGLFSANLQTVVVVGSVGTMGLAILISIIVVSVKNATARDLPQVRNVRNEVESSKSEVTSSTLEETISEEDPAAPPQIDQSGNLVPKKVKKPRKQKVVKPRKEVVFPDPPQEEPDSFHDGTECDDLYEAARESWEDLSAKPSADLKATFESDLGKAAAVCPDNTQKSLLQANGPVDLAKKRYEESKSVASSTPSNLGNVKKMEKALTLVRLFSPDFEKASTNAAHVIFNIVDPTVKANYEKLKTTGVVESVKQLSSDYQSTANLELEATLPRSEFYSGETLEEYVSRPIPKLLCQDLSDPANLQNLEVQVNMLNKINSLNPTLKLLGVESPVDEKKVKVMNASKYVKDINSNVESLINYIGEIKDKDVKLTRGAAPCIDELMKLRNSWKGVDISGLQMVFNVKEKDVVEQVLKVDSFRTEVEEKLKAAVMEVFIDAATTTVKDQRRVGDFIKSLRDYYKFKPKSPEMENWKDTDSIRTYFAKKYYDELKALYLTAPPVDPNALFDKFTELKDKFVNKLKAANSVIKTEDSYELFAKAETSPSNADELKAFFEEKAKPVGNKLEVLQREAEKFINSDFSKVTALKKNFEDKLKAAKTTQEFKDKYHVADPAVAAKATYFLKSMIGEQILKRKSQVGADVDAQKNDPQMQKLLTAFYRAGLDQAAAKNPKNEANTAKFEHVFELALQTVDLKAADFAGLGDEEKKAIQDFIKLAKPSRLYLDVQPTVALHLDSPARVFDLLKMPAENKNVLATYLFTLDNYEKVHNSYVDKLENLSDFEKNNYNTLASYHEFLTNAKDVLPKIPESFKENSLSPLPPNPKSAA